MSFVARGSVQLFRECLQDPQGNLVYVGAAPADVDWPAVAVEFTFHGYVSQTDARYGHPDNCMPAEAECEVEEWECSHPGLVPTEYELEMACEDLWNAVQHGRL